VTTPDVDPPLGGIVGTSINRVDGPLKVAGRAPYSAEFPLDNLLYGVMVQSTIARGAIIDTDTSAASRIPGVVRVLTTENAPKLASLQKYQREHGAAVY